MVVIYFVSAIAVYLLAEKLRIKISTYKIGEKIFLFLLFATAYVIILYRWNNSKIIQILGFAEFYLIVSFWTILLQDKREKLLSYISYHIFFIITFPFFVLNLLLNRLINKNLIKSSQK